MRRGEVIGWLVAGALAMLAPAPARADRVSDFQALQAQEKAQRELQDRALPLLDAKRPSIPASELLALHVEHGALVLRTTLPTSYNQRRVKIDDQPDWSLLVVQGGSNHKKTPIIPLFFSLSRMIIAPLRTETLYLQQSGRMSLNLSLQEQTPAGTRIVLLQEQLANAQTHAPNSCQLVITEMTPGRPWTPITLTSNSFEALEREHPLEVEQYLRPLLGQVDQESALTPDPMLAFEVFSSKWPADAATTAKVTALVAGLGSGDFRSRARAQSAIEALGADAALVLVRLDRSKLGPEQYARIDAVLAPYHPLPQSDVATLRSDPQFLAGCLYSSDLAVRQSAFAQLLAVTRLPLTFDPAAAPATRAGQISALLKQIAPVKPAAKKP